MSDIKQSLRA